MSHSLVEKFRKVDVPSEALLPEEDVRACRDEQARYDTAITQLSRWELFFLMQMNLEPSFHTIEREKTTSAYVVFQRNKVKDEEETYRENMFTPAYALSKFPKMKQKVKLYFVNTIYTYFEKKYSLSLTRSYNPPRYNYYAGVDDEKLNALCDYRKIIDEIKAQLGGTLDFKAIAMNKHIAAFRKNLYANQVDIKNKDLMFNSYYSPWYMGRHLSDDGNDPLRKLDAAISIWEHDEVLPDHYFGHLYGKEAITGSIVPVPKSERIEGVKFYQNRKLVIRFKTPQDLIDFTKRFEFETLEQSRW